MNLIKRWFQNISIIVNSASANGQIHRPDKQLISTHVHLTRFHVAWKLLWNLLASRFCACSKSSSRISLMIASCPSVDHQAYACPFVRTQWNAYGTQKHRNNNNENHKSSAKWRAQNKVTTIMMNETLMFQIMKEWKGERSLSNFRTKETNHFLLRRLSSRLIPFGRPISLDCYHWSNYFSFIIKH